MSYILDALERSEHERKQGELPSFRQEQALLYMRRERRSPWLILLVAVLLLNAMVFLYIHFAGTVDAPSPALADVESRPLDQEPAIVSASSAESVVIAKAKEMEGAKAAEQANPLLMDSMSSPLQSDMQPELPRENLSDRQQPIVAPRLVGAEAPILHDRTISGSQASETIPVPVTRPVPVVAAMEVEAANETEMESQFELIEPKSKRQASNVRESAANISTKDRALQSGLSEQSASEKEVFDDQVYDDTAATEPYAEVRYLGELDRQTRPQVSQLTFNSYIYSSTPSARRVMINNVYLREGQEFQGMTLLSISEQYVVFEKDGQKFKIAAMRDWLG